MNPEREIEIKLWDWLVAGSLKDNNNVVGVYFNSINEVGCKKFRVIGNKITIPDMIVKFINPFTKKANFMAIEVKDAKLSKNVRDGISKLAQEYLFNYIEGNTKYLIDNKEISIDYFALASQFSPEGHLFLGERPEVNNKLRGNKKVIGKSVPIWEFAHTKESYRIMLASYAKYRKDKKVGKNKLPGLGILISDNLLKFDLSEGEVLTLDGNPLFQGVQFNNKLMRWSQCLINL